jgi:hypothetical protein
MRKVEPGQATILEPYSALAPATPPMLPENLGARFKKPMAAGREERHQRTTTTIRDPGRNHSDYHALL